MAKPKIRHLALFARNPKQLADFYTSVFDMEVVHNNGKAYFLSDGYLMLALLPHSTAREAAVGLNHFGFTIEDREEIAKKIVALGLEEPKARPSDRPYAEFRACDPEGNQFDLSEEGLKVGKDAAAAKKEREPVGAAD